MKTFLAILGLSLVLVTEADLAEEGKEFEGDIVLTPEQKMLIDEHRDLAEVDSWQGGASKYRHWPNGVIPYVVDSSLANEPKAMRVIRSAMREWSQKTCITFVQRTTEQAFVDFKFGKGCSSYIGREYGSFGQPLILAKDCWYHGIVVHEIGHALGLWHEQSRPDRDDYVTIVWNNIRKGYKNQFEKHTDSKIDSLGVPYDYDSIMHYSRKHFTKNGGDTIVPKQSARIGQRRALSDLDVRQVNLLYKCGGTQAPAPTTAPPCIDTVTFCKRYSRNCSTNNFMKKHCRKTCNFC